MLTSQINPNGKRALIIPELLKKENPSLVRNTIRLYVTKKQEIEKLTTGLKLMIKELDLMKPLLKTGSVSEVEILRTE